MPWHHEFLRAVMEHDLNWQIDWVSRQEAGSWKRRHECRYELASYFPLKSSFNLRRYSQARYTSPNIGIPGGCWLRSCVFQSFPGRGVESEGGDGAFQRD